jgi:hypothetical protein
MTDVTVTEAPELLAQHTHESRLERCDRCGAAATSVARLASGLDLQFCGHHAKEHAPGLLAQGARTHQK